MENKQLEVEELLEKQRTLTLQLDEMVLREIRITEETSNLEKSLAMLKHDLKEVRVFSLIKIKKSCFQVHLN